MGVSCRLWVLFQSASDCTWRMAGGIVEGMTIAALAEATFLLI
jgi:hypothetical protein